jgi:hypothetical protein
MYGKNCSKGCLSGGNFQEREENEGDFKGLRRAPETGNKKGRSALPPFLFWSAAHGLLEGPRAASPQILLGFLYYNNGVFAAERIGDVFIGIPVVIILFRTVSHNIVESVLIRLLNFAFRDIDGDREAAGILLGS